jgi:hypothetical protein
MQAVAEIKSKKYELFKIGSCENEKNVFVGLAPFVEFYVS